MIPAFSLYASILYASIALRCVGNGVGAQVLDSTGANIIAALAEG